MRHLLLLAIVMLFTGQIFAQKRVTISDNEKYFDTKGHKMDHAIKLKVIPILNGAIGLNYETTLNDVFNIDVGAGYLLNNFNGNSLFSNVFDKPIDELSNGYYLSIGPTINLNDDLLGDYWGIRTSYTFFHQKTLSTEQDYNINRFSAELIMQWSLTDHFFTEISYGLCYQFTNDQPEFYYTDLSPVLFLINISAAYLF